ncbi:MAG: Stf0 family sulfotransferase [Chloroflexota bacterium]
MNIQTSYAVCGIQRSGTSLLCEALKNTGLAGFPEEYFLDAWMEDGEWARQHGVTSREGYLNLVKEKGTTANGVFGTKLMWNYFGKSIQKLQELPMYEGLDAPQLLPKIFPNMHYIWIVRQDKVRQAVSWAMAGQTGHYTAWQAEENPPLQTPVFDFEFINNLHNLVIEGESGWQTFFADCGIEPCKVVYEEFVNEYESTALRILDMMHVPYPANLVFGERKVRKQTTTLNDEWVERYWAIKNK